MASSSSRQRGRGSACVTSSNGGNGEGSPEMDVDEDASVQEDGGTLGEGDVGEGIEIRNSEVFMCCFIMDQRLGVAYYNRNTRELHAAELWEDPGTAMDFQCVHLLKFQVQPCVIYTSTKADERLLEALRSPVEGSTKKSTVKLLKSAYFGFDHAMQKLTCVRTMDVPPNLDTERWRHRLSTMLNLSREAQVRAVGALLAALHDELIVDIKRFSDGSTEEEEEIEEMDKDDDGVGRRPRAVSIRRISELKMDRYLSIDPVSYEALQIFHTDRHPSAMGLGKTKEGFSVFGMLNKCVTARGRQLLRLWFLRPILDPEEPEDRQNTIEFFCATCPEVLLALQSTLKRIKDIPKILQKLASPSALASRKDWQSLQESLHALLEIRELMEAAVSQIPAYAARSTKVWGIQLLPQVEDALNDELLHARDLVCGVLDLNQALGTRTDAIVAEGLCPELDELKHMFEALPDLLFKVMDEEMKRLPKSFLYHMAGVQEQRQQHNLRLQNLQQGGDQRLQYQLPDPRGQGQVPGTPTAPQQPHDLRPGRQQGQGQDLDTARASDEPGAVPARGHAASPGGPHMGLCFVYLPQIGYLLRVPGNLPIPDHILQELPDFELAFEAEEEGEGHCRFYHSSKTRELDTVLGDIFHKILDMESVILGDLTSRLVDHHSDCLLGATAVAARIDWLTRPQLTHKNILQITGGRHLLQELAVDTFVPNDTSIKEADGRILVITGPNFSGKSVYVKQVALITFLAHIGSFVPAERAIVGYTDRIFTRVASKDSSTCGPIKTNADAALRQSTFAVDVKQVVSMMRHATPSSLCIVDEFGKGTLTSDGVGLLCAMLSHMSSLDKPNKLLLCTHFSQIANPAYLPPSPKVAFYTMSILDPQHQKQQAQRGSEITFLYRLTLGRTLESYGFHCAALAGVPSEVVDRAREIERCLKEGRPVQRNQSASIAQRDARYKALLDELCAWDTTTETAWGFLRRVHPLPNPASSASPQACSDPAANGREATSSIPSARARGETPSHGCPCA